MNSSAVFEEGSTSDFTDNEDDDDDDDESNTLRDTVDLVDEMSGVGRGGAGGSKVGGGATQPFTIQRRKKVELKRVQSGGGGGSNENAGELYFLWLSWGLVFRWVVIFWGDFGIFDCGGFLGIFF